MRWPRFNDAVGAVVILVVLVVVGYSAVFQNDEGSKVAMVGVLGMAASYLYRGKVQEPKS